MMRNVTLGLLLASFMLLGTGRAEDNEKTARPVAASSDESAAKTIVYIARNSPANALSAAIAVFLEGTDSRVVSDVISNVLLIQTTAENQERIIALLQQLDRVPHTLRIQMHLLKARGESLAELDTASLSGRTDEVLNSIELLKSKGRAHVANRIELTAVENQPAFLQVGEDIQLPAATTSIPGRGASTNYRSVAVGTIFKVQARLSGESDIVMVVDFEKSAIDQRNVVADEESSSVPQGPSQLTLQTTVRLRNGNSFLVGGLISKSSDGDEEAYLVVSAAVVGGHDAKPAPKADAKPTNRTSEAKPLDPRYLEYYIRLIAKYDQNNDKALDADERSKMSKDCSEADKDKDGLVNVEELAMWSMKR